MGCICNACDPCCRRLGCSCKDHDGEPMASIANNRSCTDMPCIGLFGAFVLFLVSYVWSTAFSDGDPDRLIRGVNYRGLICGKDLGVEDLPYAFWPDINSYRFKVCTKDCNTATEINYAENHIVDPIYQTVGLVGYKSEPYLEKYCLPVDASMQIAGFDDYSNKIQRYMGDVELALPVIGASIGVAFILSFLYIWLMKCCVGVLVWSTIVAIIFGGSLLGHVLLDKADDDKISESDKDIRTYSAYIIWGLTAIFFLIILFSRNRIRIAIQVIKSAGRSIGDMPMMVFFPIWPLVTIVGFFFAWVFAAIYIFSAGEKQQNDTPAAFQGEQFLAENNVDTVPAVYNVIDYDNTIRNSFAPHFFLLLWVVQISVYFTFTVIAGSVADWYFTKRDENGKKLRGSEEDELSHRPVLNSCCRTSRYHLGTIIYAALIIAIIQFIRWTVRYLERTMNGGKEPNKIQKILMRAVDCLLWCLECCLDKISRNALIWTSIYGDPFCPSVCGSFKLIWANLMRVAVITFFSTIVTALGKIMIPLLTVGLSGVYLLYMEPFKSELGSPVLPLVIILVIAIAVTLLFLTVYDTAIDTVFLCFLIDEKVNMSSGTMLADDGLKNIVQKYEAESKKLAASIQKTNAGATTEIKVNEQIDI